MTLEELTEHLKWRLKKESQTGSTFTPNLKKEISLAAIYHLNTEWRWNGLWVQSSFATVAATDEVILPMDINELFALWHTQNTNRKPIKLVNHAQFLQSYTDSTETDLPYMALWTRRDGALAQPSSASVISVVSSSASDTTQKVRISGIVGGYLDAETVSLNGTTSVSTTKSFTRVDSAAKSASTVGRVTLTSNSGAVTNAVLPANYLTNNFSNRILKLFPIPDDAYTIYYVGYKKQFFMTNDYDIPVINDIDHDEAILARAEYQFTKDPDALNTYNGLVKKLRTRDNDSPAQENLIYPNQKFDEYVGDRPYGPNYSFPYGNP